MIPTTDPVTPLGEIIEQRRLELGLTKSEAARRAGVSRGTWHEIEAGRRANMLADTLNLFDQALGWDRGTLRRLSRPLEGRPDLVSTPQGAVAVEFKQHAWGDEESIRDRQRLASLAVTLPAEEVHRVVRFIETDSAGGHADDLRDVKSMLVEILDRLEERNRTAHERSIRTRPPARGEQQAP